MKTTYPVPYLWLLAGLLFYAGQLVAQHPHHNHPPAPGAYKTLGWMRGARTLQVPVTATDGHQLRTPLSALAMLGNDIVATKAVQKFAAVYPGRESIVFTRELLAIFNDTKGQTEGFHLFFGVENGQFTPMIVHTDIDTNAVVGVPHDENERRGFRAIFTTAYFWNNATRSWQLVEDRSGLKLLKARILANRQQFPFNTKGYYLSKDALVNAWKSAGQQPLAMLFQLEHKQVYLVCPSYNPIDVTKALLKIIGTKARSFPLRINLLHTGGPSIRRVMASHTPIRSCPTYCGDEAGLTTK